MLDFSGGYEYLEQWTVQYGKFWSRDPQEADWSVQHNHFLSSHHFLIGYVSCSILLICYSLLNSIIKIKIIRYYQIVSNYH